MYKNYAKEIEGAEVLTFDHGFCVFKILEGGICYITEIYVEKSHRKSGLASEMADKACEIAKTQGCSILVGSVDLNSNTKTLSMKALLGYGLEVSHRDGDLIFFKKSLEQKHG